LAHVFPKLTSELLKYIHLHPDLSPPLQDAIGRTENFRQGKKTQNKPVKQLNRTSVEEEWGGLSRRSREGVGEVCLAVSRREEDKTPETTRDKGPRGGQEGEDKTTETTSEKG
jgi:hypothetical protein